MNDPVVTAAAPVRKVKSLAQAKVDFTSEGAPPPGQVGGAAIATAQAGQAADGSGGTDLAGVHTPVGPALARPVHKRHRHGK
jgi:hypothetical protein